MRRAFRMRLVALVVVWTSTAHAGTLCGTVRDALSANPIANAGVFVRNTDWTYTGMYAASAADGAWCIDPIPAGTYHVDVRVDNYRIGLVQNVVVTGGASGVDITAQQPRAFLNVPWPNPAQGRVNFRMRLAAPGAALLAVYDVAGRRVHAWSDGDAAAGERALTWDFRDDLGREVPTGRYYLRLEAGGVVVTRPFARVR